MMRRSAGAFQSRLLSRIAWLLSALVVFLALAFSFFASSFCITLLLGGFLAILIDPLVTFLEHWRIPRSGSAAIIVVAGLLIFCTLSYASYNQLSVLVDQVPQYSNTIREAILPFYQKIAKVQETAGTLTPETPSRRVAEVKIKEPPTWPAYVVRGAAPAWSAIVIIGVVPFLTFFNLIRKRQMVQRLDSALGDVIDVPRFTARVTKMVRGFAMGNLLIGSVMAFVTVAVLLALKIHGAVAIGVLSGFLNLVPFLGAVVAIIPPLAAAILQFHTAAPFAAIFLTVVGLHIIAANYLIPRIVGSRVNLGPVASTCGILFWGWLWGLMGILLAIPLTAFVKIVADSHPSLIHISNLLAQTPRAVPKPIDPANRPADPAAIYDPKRSFAK
jgi:predicted PurR-regulated permease PerM